MNVMTAHGEKLLLASMAILLAIAVTMTLPKQSAPVRSESGNQSHTRFVPSALPESSPNPVAWSAPSPQSAGQDWVFELFTPPIIYFDPGTKLFSVTPPTGPTPHHVMPNVELVGIEQDLYRLQYRGYAGAEGNYSIQLRSEETGRWYRGKVGASFPEEQFRIVDFSVGQRLVATQGADGAPSLEAFTRLKIVDERTGETIELGNTPLFTATWHACIRTLQGTELKLAEGETQFIDGISYQLVALNPDKRTVRLHITGAGMGQPVEQLFTLKT